MQKQSVPNLEAIFQEIEVNSRRPSETLHKLWLVHAENASECQ